MRNENGGSSHDPKAVLPAPMWERGPLKSNIPCRSCRARLPREQLPRHMHSLSVGKGPVPGTFLMCRLCDGGPKV
jgi:hypothetical protein